MIFRQGAIESRMGRKAINAFCNNPLGDLAPPAELQYPCRGFAEKWQRCRNGLQK
jgi:hypothetical protein